MSDKDKKVDPKEPGVRDVESMIPAPLDSQRLVPGSDEDDDFELPDDDDEGDGDEGDDPNDKKEDGKQDEDPESKPFTGFGQDDGAQTDSAILDRLDKMNTLLGQLVKGKSDEGGIVDLTQLSREQIEKLAKEDPGKLLIGTLDGRLKELGLLESRSGITRDELGNVLTQRELTSKYRAAITEEFDPANNPKLVAKAQELYEQKVKAYGNAVTQDPKAEYESFVLAVTMYPELRPDARQRSSSTRTSRNTPGSGGKRRPQEGDEGLTKEQRRIARRWGLDLNDKKMVKRIKKLDKHYKDRRI